MPKITFFSDYVQKLSSILGKIGSNDRKSNNFLENRVKNCNFRRKIEIFGTSRRHRRGSKHLVGGIPPKKFFSGASRRHLWGGIPPTNFGFYGGGFWVLWGGICPKIFLWGGIPPRPPPQWETLEHGERLIDGASLTNGLLISMFGLKRQNQESEQQYIQKMTKRQITRNGPQNVMVS